MNRCMIVLCLVLLAMQPAARADELASMPGYVDFEALHEVYGEPRVMINISGFLLKFMAAASRDDPQSAALMRNLDGVRVTVYDTAGVTTPALEQITAVKKMLKTADWQPVVQVKESGEEVQIFMKADDEGMQGLTVMTLNEKEAVFINILGNIDPEQLDDVMGNLNIDVQVNQDRK